MITFLAIGALLALVPVLVGLKATVEPTSFEHTFLGYSFLGLALYVDLLGCLWELTS